MPHLVLIDNGRSHEDICTDLDVSRGFSSFNLRDLHASCLKLCGLLHIPTYGSGGHIKRIAEILQERGCKTYTYEGDSRFGTDHLGEIYYSSPIAKWAKFRIENNSIADCNGCGGAIGNQHQSDIVLSWAYWNHYLPGIGLLESVPDLSEKTATHATLVLWDRNAEEVTNKRLACGLVTLWCDTPPELGPHLISCRGNRLYPFKTYSDWGLAQPTTIDNLLASA